VSALSCIPKGNILQPIGSDAGLDDLDGLLEQIRNDLHPGQRAFFDDNQTEILGLSAGYGAGKTRALCARAVALAALNQGFTGCVMEPTGPLIRDIWMTDFETFLEHYGIPYTFRASPLPEYILHLPNGDTKILCRSFENWSRIIGLNLAWVLADEIDTVNPTTCSRAFPKILGRLRSGNVRQFAAASTPEGFRWMWQTFGSEDAQKRDDRKLRTIRFCPKTSSSGCRPTTTRHFSRRTWKGSSATSRPARFTTASAERSTSPRPHRTSAPNPYAWALTST
jgi:hypothetical protein